MRGDKKGTEGKVTRVNRQKYRMYVEGVTREKVDGSTTLIPIHPSKVMITNLNLEDKWRIGLLKEAKEVKEKEESVEKSEKKPIEEKVEVPKTKRKERKPRKTPARRKKAEVTTEESEDG
jgi:large subunit ribosomal protein L24